jgi:hypothetical protein
MLQFLTSLTIDLTQASWGNKIAGIESLSLENGEANQLMLDREAVAELDVLNREVNGVAALDDTLTVLGEAGDKVTLKGTWVNAGAAGAGFTLYALNGLKLAIDNDVTATIVPVVTPTPMLAGLDGFRFDGLTLNDGLGFSVASAGDVNGDGFDDVIIGAYQADRSASNAGASYVVFGHAGGFASNIDLSALSGTNGFRLDGAAASDFSGFSVSAAGDVNGDGFGDLLVGAVRADQVTATSDRGRISGIETLDMTNGSANTLRIDRAAVLDLNVTNSDANGAAIDNVLFVRGDAGQDTVDLVGAWTPAGAAGAGFTLYTLDNLKVAVEDTVTVI